MSQIEEIDQSTMAAASQNKKGKSDPRNPDFIIKYEKSNFSKGD